MTTLLLLAVVAVFGYFIIRAVLRIADWRIVLAVLTIGILAGTGVLNMDAILGEIGHALSAIVDQVPAPPPPPYDPPGQ
jgi:hypothetical protein